ncbi:MAG: CDP-glycerol glycerophosphotransferase family protein [Candidatus Fimivivens sp.]
MVTVVCITYNHEEYIAQALDSFLMQKTDFKFKVFVGEDCGPGRTADIVREYAAKYPDIIVPFLREENMGAQRNLIDLCQRATSPYIAFCEGDDYWIDENKLQKQVDYMEAHSALRACFAKAKIDAPDNWFLRDYYKKDGDLIYPDCEPKYQLPNRFMNMRDFIWFFPAHTSTVFYRWNYDLKIPEWFYRGIMGDLPIFLMQLGAGETFYIPDVVSVYRRSDVGIFMSSNMDEHFLKTRLDHLRWMEGMLIYYATYGIPNHPKINIENRIKAEARNFIKTALKVNDYEAIQNLINQYPNSTKIALGAYISFYDDSRSLTAVYGWDGYKMAVRNRYYRRFVRPLVRAALIIKKKKDFLKGKLKNICSLGCYWKYTFIPKRKNIWAFSGFFKRGYMDNIKYLYEYVLEHHPEIQAVWMTLDKNVYKQLQAENKPVVMMRTPECRKILSRAAVAFTDHYKMSDYDAFSGLNDKTKIVQLWHGVGLKAIGDLKNTDIPGVMLSNDILPSDSDNVWRKIIKKIKYFRHAYYRELFERYFMLVCPGPERIAQVAKPLNIPIENCFMSGHPRNILLHQTFPDTDAAHILYAPTYRWSTEKEQQLVQQIINSAEAIQACMNRANGYLTIRLHPHTWRNYNALLNDLTQRYNRILLDNDADIYQTLGNYRILISDYSSIAYDFILLNRPVVFFNYDFKDFIKNECALNYDYDAYSPGFKTQTWEQTLAASEAYLADPEKDSVWRCRVRDEFYDMSVNDKDNSKRIVEELKRRLDII